MALVLGAVLAVGAFGVAAAQTGGGATGQTVQDYGQSFLDKLAQILGIERSRLDSAIRQADLQVIDQAEQNGDLSRNQADALRERAALGPAPGWFGMGRWHGGWGHHGWRGGRWAGKVLWNNQILDAAASALGMARDDLLTELRNGKTLGEVADARNVDRQKVRDAVTAAYKGRLDAAVQEGGLTQAQADRLLQRFQDADVLSAGLGGCRGWWKGGSGGGSAGGSGDTGTTGTSNSL